MRISIDQPPYVIGEVGACHNGRLQTALDLILVASESGCRAVKFQLYDAVRLCQRRQAPELFEMYARYQLPHEWLPKLKALAQAQHLEFILSVYDKGDLDHARAHADWLKISSFESHYDDLLRACIDTSKPTLVSTGMNSRAELRTLRSVRDMAWRAVGLLHCISAYPAPLKDLNLAAISTEDLDGYSDHSANVLAGAVAVAHGARILEVHIRDIDTPEDNPDYAHALNPSKLTDYIGLAIRAQIMGGTGVRELAESERGNVQYRVKG